MVTMLGTQAITMVLPLQDSGLKAKDKCVGTQSPTVYRATELIPNRACVLAKARARANEKSNDVPP